MVHLDVKLQNHKTLLSYIYVMSDWDLGISWGYVDCRTHWYENL